MLDCRSTTVSEYHCTRLLERESMGVSEYWKENISGVPEHWKEKEISEFLGIGMSKYSNAVSAGREGYNPRLAKRRGMH